MYLPRRRAAGYVFLTACLYDGQVARASRPDSGLQGSLDLGRLLAQPGRAAAGAIGFFDQLRMPYELAWKLVCDEKIRHKGITNAKAADQRAGFKCKVTCSTRDVSPSFVWADKIQGGFEREAIRNMTGKSAYVLSSLVLDSFDGNIFYEQYGLKAGWYVLTDFFSQGVLKGELEHLTERRAAAYFWQLARGMQDMHDQNLVHMNINLESIYVHCEGLVCYAALVQLQHACQTGQKFRPHDPKNDEKYFRPPEISRGEHTCSPSYDVWSMGVLLHYLFFRKYPDNKEPQIKAAVEAYEKEKKTDTKPEVIQKVQAILEKALAPDPAQRVAGAELLDEARQLLELADAEQAAKIVDKVPSEYGARKPAPKCLNVWPDGPHCGTGTLQKSAVLSWLSYEYFSWQGGDCSSSRPDGCVRCACDDEATQTHFEYYLKSC